MRTSSANLMITATGSSWRTIQVRRMLVRLQSSTAILKVTHAVERCNLEVKTLPRAKILAGLKIPVLEIIGLNLQGPTTYVRASYEKVCATTLNITDTPMPWED